MTAIVVLLDGRPVAAYVQPFERGGRVYAPVHPYVTQIADRIEYRGTTIVIRRANHSVHVGVVVVPNVPNDREYVPLADVMRALGEDVTYDARHRTVNITTPDGHEIATPSPFDPVRDQAPPRAVFTPNPIATKVPVWSGRPIPRRTPLPLTSSPTAAQRGPTPL